MSRCYHHAMSQSVDSTTSTKSNVGLSDSFPDEASMQEQGKSDVKCEVCGTKPFKYKCPGCFTKTCSLPCVKKHKVATSCDGKRDRAAYVSLKDFSERELLNGKYLLSYNFKVLWDVYGLDFYHCIFSYLRNFFLTLSAFTFITINLHFCDIMF